MCELNNIGRREIKFTRLKLALMAVFTSLHVLSSRFILLVTILVYILMGNVLDAEMVRKYFPCSTRVVSQVLWVGCWGMLS
jgi:hypothetical protein